MTVTVRLFASLRERAGRDRLVFEVEPACRLGTLLARLEAELPFLHAAGRLAIAVNEEYARPETELAEGDEIALIPPVSGGCAGRLP